MKAANEHEHDLGPDGGCAATRERLPLFVGRDLDRAECTRVEQHLAGCAACRAECERMASAFRGYFASEHRAAARELEARGLWEGVRAAIERERVGAPAPVHSMSAAPDAEERLEGTEGDLDGLELELELAGAGRIDERAVRGRLVLLRMGGGVLAAAAVLALAAVLWKAPRWSGEGAREGSATELAGDAHLVEPAPPATAGGGLRPIDPSADRDRLIYQAREAELVPARGDGNALVGHPTWR